MSKNFLYNTIAMAALAGMDPLGISKPNPLYGVDIKKEYDLIQQKKSKLSSRLRESVEASDSSYYN